jgi:hypothetical protein
MYTLVKMFPCALVAALGVMVGTARIEADESVADDPLNYSGPARKQDEVVLLSTRHLGVPLDNTVPALSLLRFNEKEQWETLSLEALAGGEANVPTLIYVHGYDFDEEKAERVGWAFYHAFCDDLPADERVRLVIWSWPTVAKRFRPVRDFIDKARRSDTDAYYLAWFIAQLPREARVGVAGSALGCQVVQGALHLLGGGALGELRLDDAALQKSRQISAVFIAPAVNNDWLYPGGYHQQAPQAASQLLLVNNPIDAALCRYGQPWKSKPVALGQSGLTDLAKLGEFARRIEQLDASEQIGEEHGVEHYLRQDEIVARMRKKLVPR